VPKPLQVFVSSVQTELRDLRATVRDFLQAYGMSMHLAEDSGFPRVTGEKPYITCLRTVEESQLVVGVIQDQYGEAYTDWQSYPEYSGLSATHAEFLHALNLGKKFLLYINNSTDAAYALWKDDPSGYEALAGRGPDVDTLKLIDALMTRQVPPWRETFGSASDVIASLRRNLVNEIVESLHEQERRARGQAEYLTEQILAAAPEIRKKVQESIDPGVVAEIERLENERNKLEERLNDVQQASQQSFENLQNEKLATDAKLTTLQAEVEAQRVVLTMAAVGDAQWLHAVRTQMMPKQPGRVPFHNALEVAMRGYNVAGASQQPNLAEVTWSLLPYNEGGLHRGYRAGLIFRGSGFAPGVTWSERRKNGSPASLEDRAVWWRLPNIYFGDYLEVSTHDDPEEGPVGHLNFEFAVKNPEGQMSEWVAFSYPFDEAKLRETIRLSADRARGLVAAHDHAAAVEPFRKAMVYSDRLLGETDPQTVSLRREWDAALDNAALARLRFRKGDRVRLKDGQNVSKVGTIKELHLRHVHAYRVETEGGETVQVGDEDVMPF
jgi:Domain of unknown function (DUF4062)